MARKKETCINFFARELASVMAEKGHSLWTICSNTDIHREVIRRLHNGLHLPGNVSMLNPYDLDEVIAVFRFDASQIIRLRAAVVANSVMAVLVTRIRLESASAATELIYEHVVKRMKKGDKGFSDIRHHSEIADMVSLVPTPGAEDALENILPLIDRATGALHMGRGLAAAIELPYLWQARAGYEAALHLLDETSDTVKATDAWQYWHTEAQKALMAAEESIEDVQIF